MKKEYLMKKLNKLVSLGVKLMVDGKPATPKFAAKLLCEGKGSFSPGFSFSEDGNLSELDYVRIA